MVTLPIDMSPPPIPDTYQDYLTMANTATPVLKMIVASAVTQCLVIVMGRDVGGDCLLGSRRDSWGTSVGG
jgi:hypothetical protein